MSGFRASTNTKHEVYVKLKRTVGSLAAEARGFIHTINSGGVTASQLLAFHDKFVRALEEHDAIRDSAPSLTDYARDQEGDPEYDLEAETDAVVAKGRDVVAWIVENFPQDAEGYLLMRRRTEGGKWEWRRFSTEDLSGYLDVLQAFADAVA